MDLADEMREELNNRIIPFWKKMKDDVNGGFFGYMGYDLKTDEKAVKGCILNSRITWFFSRAYLVTADESLREYANHGYNFLTQKCLDNEYGGVYWDLDYEGHPLDTTKHTYNQAFAIYALCAYFEAFHSEDALGYAFRLFEVIEKKCTDEYGYMEAFKRDFSPEFNEKLSENGVMADKTMNTLLHVLEAYTQLYKLTKDDRVSKRLYRILEIIETKIYNPNLTRQEVFFDREYNTILDLHSYGHDIETSWLLYETLDVLGDDELYNRLSVICDALCECTYNLAFDGHSFANECENGVVNELRIWWVQAEAVVGFVNEWQRHPKDVKYLDAAKNEWNFIKEYVADKRDGSEWYGEVDKMGKPNPNHPIVEPWKCPYHNGRMCCEIIKRLDN